MLMLILPAKTIEFVHRIFPNDLVYSPNKNRGRKRYRESNNSKNRNSDNSNDDEKANKTKQNDEFP